jgi:hypothetical protein
MADLGVPRLFRLALARLFRLAPLGMADWGASRLFRLAARTRMAGSSQAGRAGLGAARLFRLAPLSMADLGAPRLFRLAILLGCFAPGAARLFRRPSKTRMAGSSQAGRAD